MSKPKKQHYIPQCYLREFVDPNTPVGQEPYVWIFNKGEKKGRKKAPSNILSETDLYTLHLTTGKKDYVIENTLSTLESRYAEIFRNKIEKHLPLDEEEHVLLCAFVSAMLHRTLRHKDNMERFIDELVEKVGKMEQAHGVEPKQSEELNKYKETLHKTGIIQTMPAITNLLVQMSLAFLVAEPGAKFITSDDPCNLFNPELQWQRFYGPGLAQKKIELTLPLSPQIMLLMSWSNLKGYIIWKKSQVQEANRLIRGHAYKYFVSHSPKPKRKWFRNYPLSPVFLFRILKHKFREKYSRANLRARFRNVNKT